MCRVVFSSVTHEWPFHAHLLSITLLIHRPLSLETSTTALQSLPCADMRHLCYYICLIWTHCNQQCDQKHCYTYISHYWHMFQTNMSAKFFIHVPLHCYHNLSIEPTSLHLWVKNVIFNYQTIAMYMPMTNILLKCHKCQWLHVHICQNYISIYLIWTHCKWTMWPETLAYIYFTLLAYAPEKYVYQISYVCPTALLPWSTYRFSITTYRSKKKQQTVTLIYHAITIHVLTTNMSIKC